MNINTTNTTNLTTKNQTEVDDLNSTNSTITIIEDPSEPPIVPKPSCVLYGIERFNNSNCTKLDESY